MTTCADHSKGTHFWARGFFFSSRRRHSIFDCDLSSDVCSSDLRTPARAARGVVFGKGASPVKLFPAQLRAELLKMFARKRTWIGFGLFLAVELLLLGLLQRSEERRVGKEGRSRWSPDH